MYRSRLKGKLDKEALDYLSSIRDDIALMHFDIVGSEAHSVMLYKQGLITRAELRKILAALESARSKDLMKLASGYEDIHEAIEAFVVKKAGLEAGGKMHTARSRNDQVALDIRLKSRDDINHVSMLVIELVRTLLEKASKNKDSVMPMYTHLQHAQIGTFSHYLISYSDALLRDLERLYACYDRVNRSPLGAVAIGGTSIKIDRIKVASLLGFDSIVENSIDATTSRDVLVEMCFCLAMIMLDLSRIAEDFILWSSSEFDFIELSDDLTSSSSVMPQKKNPCPLELMRAKTAFAIGLLFSLMSTVKALPSGYSRDLQDTKRVLFQAVEVTIDSLKIMNSVIRTLSVKRKNMLVAAESSYAISLDIAEELVRHKMAFREAHKVVGQLVKTASRSGKELRRLTDAEIRDAVGIEFAGLVRRIIDKIDARQSVNCRVSLGSPNPKKQDRMIKVRRKYLNKLEVLLQQRMKRVGSAFQILGKMVKSL
jgi:argininosuccinate lyase